MGTCLAAELRQDTIDEGGCAHGGRRWVNGGASHRRGISLMLKARLAIGHLLARERPSEACLAVRGTSDDCAAIFECNVMGWCVASDCRAKTMRAASESNTE